MNTKYLSKTNLFLSIILLVIVSLVGCNLFSSAPSGKFYALVYGVEVYDNINNLSSTVDDAEDFANSLSKVGYNIRLRVTDHYSNSSISVNGPDAPNKTNIMSDITYLANIADSEDTTVFYFSGHGAGSWRYKLGYDLNDFSFTQNNETNLTVLLPSNTMYSSSIIYSDTVIFADELLIALQAIPGKKILILDICHSGGFVPSDGYDIDGIPEDYGDTTQAFTGAWERFFSDENLVQKFPDIWVITASGAEEQSFESSSIKNGYFTFFLLEGFGYNHASKTINDSYPADSNHDGYITINEAYEYTTNNFKKSDFFIKAPITADFQDPYSIQRYLPHLSGGPEDIILVDTGKRTY